MMPAAHTPELTEREKEVLLWHARGKSSEVCAQIMGVSPRTISNQLVSCREKLYANNTTHAVAKAIKKGVIKLSDVYLIAAVLFAGTVSDMDATITRIRLRQPQVRISRVLSSSESSGRT